MKLEQMSDEANEAESLKLLKGPSSIVKPTAQFSDINELIRDLPITDDTACGLWCLRGPFLQRFANKKVYVLLYGLAGLLFAATGAYFNGTITTIEKRFRISSQATGLINAGYDIAQLFTSFGLIYYAGKGHRPRWIAFGLFCIGSFCLLTMLPHFLYGPGEDALLLTEEYGGKSSNTNKSVILNKQRKNLCLADRTYECDQEEGNLAPQLLLFCAQFISGIGGTLYYTLGISFMDDNVQKSKTPALISISMFLRMLGPAIGYALASFTLKFYVSPTLTPIITTSDPRWLGAWWLGWIILASLLLILGCFVVLFPKTLPRAAARKILAFERNRLETSADAQVQVDDGETTFSELIDSLKRLLTNATYMLNTFAAVFYFFGYLPYWIFMPKYIETQYRQSASFSSLITGTVGLVFSAFGILLSGLVISKCKPTARHLAMWNVVVGIFSVIGVASYAFLGCATSDNQIAIPRDGSPFSQFPCNENCDCDYATFSQVCSENGESFISACHAGCRSVYVNSNGSEVYTDCQCVKSKSSEYSNNYALSFNATADSLDKTSSAHDTAVYGIANSGPCPIDCMDTFYLFLAIMCAIKFFFASGRTSTFLVSLRCVEERDKTVSLGIGMAITALFTFIPSPIFFGYLIDTTCLVWGKTCSSSGNCWLYNGEELRYLMNFFAAGFIAIGTLFDVGVWYYVKDLLIFDEEIELEDTSKKQETESSKSDCKNIIMTC